MFTKKETKNSEPEKVENKQSNLEGPKTDSSKREKLSQKEAVYLRVLEIVKQEKLQVTLNQPVKECFNSVNLHKLHDLVYSDLKSGKARLSEETSMSDDELKSYIVGLCSNWFRRDKRLNGKEVFKA